MLHHPAVAHRLVGGKRYRHPIDYIAEWSARDVDPKAPAHIPFTLKALGGLPAVTRWLQVARKYDHQISQVLATRYRQALVSDQLLNRVAALEGFHKLWSAVPRGPTLRERLVSCGELAGVPFFRLVPDVEGWAAAAVAERNDVGHGSRSGTFEASRSFFIADAAYWLFVMCLLREMEAPAVVFDSIVALPRFTWLKHNLAEALLPDA